MLGFNYDIELEHWQKNLHGYRVFSDGKKVLLDGGLGISLNLLSGDNQYDTWLESIPQHYLTASSAFVEYQYQMLWLAANCHEAAQLLDSRPILLALICAKYSVDYDAALELAKQGQLIALIRKPNRSVWLSTLCTKWPLMSIWTWICSYCS